MTISPDFTIQDIHNIRYDNYEKTKYLSYKELIEKTCIEASKGFDSINAIRKQINSD